MSIRHLALAADIQGLSPTCKLVLYGIAINTGPLGDAPITYRQLNQATGLSERACRNAVRQLEREQILDPDAHPGFRFHRRIAA